MRSHSQDIRIGVVVAVRAVSIVSRAVVVSLAVGAGGVVAVAFSVRHVVVVLVE